MRESWEEGAGRRKEGVVANIFRAHCQLPTWTRGGFVISLSLTWKKALLATPTGLKHWGSCHGYAHANNTDALRTSSTPTQT